MCFGKRFLFGIVCVVCSSVTFIILKRGVTDVQAILTLAETYAKLIGGAILIYTGAQSVTDYKKNGGVK